MKRQAERSEQKRVERKEDRERGWEWQRQQKDAIAAAKNRERVVALDDLKSWQQQRSVSKREVWEAKTGETIEVLEDEEREQKPEQLMEKALREEKTEEHKYPIEDDEKSLPPPTTNTNTTAARPSALPPPIRSTSRLTTTFTSVHTSHPSLPARESNPPPSISAAAITTAASNMLANLLQLKDTADAYYRRKDLHSAATAYTQLLDDRQVRDGERYGWVVGRVLGNRSACYMALATRSGVAAVGQMLVNVRHAEEDALEALTVLSSVQSSEASEEERRALDEKLHKRLATLYSMQGKWKQALPHAQAAELKEEEHTISQHAEAVKQGDDLSALEQAQYLLAASSPTPFSAALRLLNRALQLSPLFLSALQLRVDVYGRLGEWDKAVRDAVLGVVLCERSQGGGEQRLWWIGRRGECYVGLKQFSAAQADLNLLASASTPYVPLTAATLPALLTSLSYQQRHHTLLSSLPALRTSQSYAQLKSTLAALLTLRAAQPSASSDDDWMLWQVELVSEQGWCELKLSEYAACVITCCRAQAMWEQWSERPQRIVAAEAEAVVEVVDDDVEQERLRLRTLESEGLTKLAHRAHRWRMLTSVRKATALCYDGRLKEGKEEYHKVLEVMERWVREQGGIESEQQRVERQEVEADVSKIDAAIAQLFG